MVRKLTYVVVAALLALTRGPDGVFYFMEVAHGSVSWTNLDNQKTFTQVFTTVTSDLSVTDNEDGTVTILVMAAGMFKVYGPEGKEFSDNGTLRFEVLVDHGGTLGDPTDDEFIEFLGIVKESTGTNDLEGRDFCDDIHELIG